MPAGRSLGQPLDGEVVRLGGARGEDHAGGGRGKQPGDLGAGAVQGRPRLEPERVLRVGLPTPPSKKGRMTATTRGSTGEKPA